MAPFLPKALQVPESEREGSKDAGPARKSQQTGAWDRGLESSEKRGLPSEAPGQEQAERRTAGLQRCAQSGCASDFIGKKRRCTRVFPHDLG